LFKYFRPLEITPPYLYARSFIDDVSQLKPDVNILQ